MYFHITSRITRANFAPCIPPPSSRAQPVWYFPVPPDELILVSDRLSLPPAVATAGPAACWHRYSTPPHPLPRGGDHVTADGAASPKILPDRPEPASCAPWGQPPPPCPLPLSEGARVRDDPRNGSQRGRGSGTTLETGAGPEGRREGEDEVSLRPVCPSVVAEEYGFG